MTQRVSPIAPVQWLLQAANIGTRNPRTLLLGATAIVSALLGTLFVVSVLAGGGIGLSTDRGTTPDIGTVAFAAAPLMLLGMLAPQLIVGGLALLIHRIETGQDARVSDAFAGVRRNHIGALSALILIPIANVVGTILIYRFLGGENYLQEYMAAMNQVMAGKQAAGPEPAYPLAMLFTSFLLTWITYAIQLLAPMQVMLAGRGPFDAIIDCLRAFFTNLPAMVFSGLLGFMILFGVVMVAVVLMLLTTALANIIPILGGLLGLALFLSLAIIGVLLWVACGYFAWKDMLGGGSPASQPPSAGIEV